MKRKPRFLQDGLHGGGALLARDDAGPPQVLAILLPTVRYCYRDLKNLCICSQTYRFGCFISLSRFIFSFHIRVDEAFLCKLCVSLFLVMLHSVTLLNSVLLTSGSFLSILWYLLCKKSSMSANRKSSASFFPVCFERIFVPLLAVLSGRGPPARWWMGSTRTNTVPSRSYGESLSPCP